LGLYELYEPSCADSRCASYKIGCWGRKGKKERRKERERGRERETERKGCSGRLDKPP